MYIDIANFAYKNQGVLYIKTSEYLAFDRRTQSFITSLKDGLFSTKGYKQDERIVAFVDGEEIDKNEMEKRSKQGMGGYMVGINKNKFLDFYKSRMNNACFASCANSAIPSNPLRNKRTDQQAFMNMYLVRFLNKNSKRWEISYKAMYDILANIELFGDYVPNISS